MKYYETYETGNSFRKEYVNSIEKLIEQKKVSASKEREEFAKKLVNNIEQYRQKFVYQLGWPLTECFSDKELRAKIPCVKKSLVTKEDDITIYRIQIEVLEDFWYYGLLFVKEDGKKRPLIVSQHGGLGTPELCSSLFKFGSSNYNEMTQRILKQDVNVFAPQMLLWDKEKYTIPYNRELIDNQLKQCGGSITALELTCLMRSLDYLETERAVDKDRMGMIGMSYGGMYTLYMAAVDTRLKSAFSCSYFCDRFEEVRSDWIYVNSAKMFSDAEAAMLVYPRKLYLAMGDVDELFNAKGSMREFERITKVMPDYENFVSLTIFSGTHEFIKEDSLIEKVVNDLQ